MRVGRVLSEPRAELGHLLHQGRDLLLELRDALGVGAELGLELASAASAGFRPDQNQSWIFAFWQVGGAPEHGGTPSGHPSSGTVRPQPRAASTAATQKILQLITRLLSVNS